MPSLETPLTKTARHPRRRRLAASVSAFALAIVQPAVAVASVPGSGLENLGARVADEDLGEIRGKFVGAGGIAYFSVEMRSSWTNADGQTVGGIMTMSLDLRNAENDRRSILPVVMIGWSRDCATCSTSAANTNALNGPSATMTGGLGTVHGVVQTQQISGSDNTVQNGLRINVMPAHLVTTTAHSGLTAATTNTSHTLSNGSAVHFQITGSQLGLALQNGDQAGIVGQMVNSNQNQISQNVLLTSDFNTVQNSLGLTIGVDQMRQAEIVNIQNSMSTLKGLGY